MKQFALKAGAVAIAASLAAPAMASENQLDMRVSLILDGIYFNELEHGTHNPAGFGGGHHHHGHGHGHDHSHGLEEGFNLGHSELAFEASLGELLDGMLMLGFDSSHIEVEEAYLKTRSLPAGFQIKGGKFLSDIGYINSRHSHDWDFVDRPLVSEYLFGDHGLQETGIQATWLAPSDTYSLFGLEVLQGTNSQLANQVGEERITVTQQEVNTGDGTVTRNRVRDSNGLSDNEGPRLFTAFAKVAPDLGHNHALQLGVSGGYSSSFQQQEVHSSARVETWDGDAWFAGVDAVYKYESGRSYGHGNLTLQAEYFYRSISVDYASRVFADGDLVPTAAGGLDDVFSGTAKQDGLYVQGVYGFAPRWEAGFRAEALGLSNDSLDVDRNNNRFESFSTSYRYAGNLTFRPAEPIFLRAQVNHNDFADDDGHGHSGWDLMFQVNVALGAHGAHTF